MLSLLPFLLFQTSLPACVFPSSFDCLSRPHGIHLPLIVIHPLSVFVLSVLVYVCAQSVKQSTSQPTLRDLLLWPVFIACITYQNILVQVNPLGLKAKLFLQTSVWSTS